MDRQIVYPGSIPLDTDLLNTERNVLTAVGYLAQATLGTATIVDGLACLPTQPASMAVTLGAGAITQLGSVDITAFGSLAAAPNQPLLRMGINLANASFALTAPTTPGQVINYLIEASLLEQDSTPVVLPYYNAANPGQPYSGPANSGNAQMTQRRQTVQFQLKAGAPGPIGSAAMPSVDAGWVGLYTVAVEYGQTTVTAGNITTLPTAPFINYKLPQLAPGTSNLAVFYPSSQGSWTAPAGVSLVKLRIWGGGGAGGSGFEGAGGGGAGGGYTEGFYPVAPGQTYIVTVGNGGAGQGSAGGTSSFGSLASATGGAAGANGSSGTGGAGATSGGVGSGTGLAINGTQGANAFGAGGNWLSGAGGGAYGGAGAPSATGSASGNIVGQAAWPLALVVPAVLVLALAARAQPG